MAFPAAVFAALAAALQASNCANSSASDGITFSSSMIVSVLSSITRITQP